MIRLVVVGLAAGALILLPTSSEARTAQPSCPMSHVHYTPYPGAEQGLAALPWIAAAPAGSFKAHLFFYDPHLISWAKERLLGARIFTIRKRRRINPKVLWITRAKGYGRTLEMTGQRLDAPGRFSATYQGFGDYPSYVSVPAPGCWRVSVTSGHVTGHVVFSATD